jgi:hypothetical protein
LFSAYVDGNNFFLIQFRENGDNGRFEVFNYSSAYDWRVETNALLRDPSAWYHIVVALDTTQATDSNRIKIYVNGTLQTLATTTYPSLNFDSDANNNIAHYIGQDGGNGRYHNGYLTEVNFIDGSAKTPSDFGETDSATGVWKPKAYSGTYGTNGFFLKFADNSGTTSTTLGKDSSGNGNNWTPNNFSVTAGVGNDSLVDTPTAYGTDTGVGGEVRGNYCTLNPLTKNNADTYTITNGNLDFDLGGPSSSSGDLRGTIGVSSGKWYWEVFCTEVTAAGNLLGITNNPTNGSDGFRALGAYTFQYYDDGTADTNKVQGTGAGTTTTNYGPNTNLLNKTIGFALDLDGGTITVYIDGSSQGTMFSSLPSGTYFPLFCLQTAKIQVNFGQRAFAYTAPSGFKALCTTNLPTPTIGATSTTQANDYFDVSIWTGNNASRNITNSGSMQPDFVWIKDRSRASSNDLVDAVRGVNKALISDSTASEYTGSFVSSFNSDGFSLPANGLGDNFYTNISGDAFVGWQWKAGGAGSSNTAGTITSTVSANTTSGFSVVTYTGNGVDGATVGHGLGVTPAMVIQKRRNGSIANWRVWHTAIYGTSGVTSTLYLNTTDASTSDADNISGVSSTTFTTRGTAATNPSGNSCVAYVFAAVANYSSFGSYVGNGSTDGPFIYTGFRPRFVMMKSSSNSSTNWRIFDIARDPSNVMIYKLSPNNSDSEYTDANTRIDFVSNGFKLRQFAGDMNTNGATYIYAAFAESPFKYALAR